MSVPDKPGIYPGLSMANYCAVPGVNYSTLKHFRRSAAHVRAYLDVPPAATEAQELGTAVHCAILEPRRFARDYAPLPVMDRRTRAGKSRYEDLLAQHPFTTFLSAADHATCVAVARSARSSRRLSALLDAPAYTEVVVIWDDPDTGLRCKCRIDRLCQDGDGTVVLDPKTTRDASPRAFAADVARYLYYLQAAFYLRGLEVAAGMVPGGRPFVFLALEKEFPYGCAPYELCAEALGEGRRVMRDYLARFAECERTGIWPGYPSDPVLLQLPGWAYPDPFEREENHDGTA